MEVKAEMGKLKAESTTYLGMEVEGSKGVLLSERYYTKDRRSGG